MLSSDIARTTSEDKKSKYPEQQAQQYGVSADHIMIWPYGLYCDAPTNTLVKQLGDNQSMPITVKRPSDAANGEPVFFHPGTNTRIIARNNGDLDILCDGSTQGNVNIICARANITASDSVNIDSPVTNLGVGGAAIARVGDEIEVTTGSGTFTGNITTGGDNTSI